MNSELTLLQIILIISIPGMCGGLIAAIKDALGVALLEDLPKLKIDNANVDIQKSLSCYYKPSVFIGRTFMGLGGAFGVILIGLWIGKLSFDSTTKNLLFLISLSLVAGLFSRKILNFIRLNLENEIVKRQINMLGKKTEENFEKFRNTAKEEKKIADSFSDGMSSAVTALDTKSKDDIKIAIQKLEAIKSEYSTHRTLHIYLGRLYREQKNYDKAILTLRELIGNSHADPETKNTVDANINIADAYYNIACYHCLKAEEMKKQGASSSEIDRLKNEAKESLKYAIQGHHSNLESAKEDVDLKLISADIDSII